MNLKELFAAVHLKEPKVKALVDMSEDIKTDVERAIDDQQVFNDTDYRLLEDQLLRALINVEVAVDLFSRRYQRKSPLSRKFVVKQYINQTVEK